MIILLILLSFFEKSIKYIPLIIGEIVFIFFIISCANVQYDMNLLRYVLFFYLLYFIILSKIGGENNEDKCS